MTTYRLAHITDLMQIPPEHWDECIKDLRACIISLHLIDAAACASGEKFSARDHCPFIDFIPDGKGEVRPMLNGEPMFVMKVERDA